MCLLLVQFLWKTLKQWKAKRTEKGKVRSKSWKITENNEDALHGGNKMNSIA